MSAAQLEPWLLLVGIATPVFSLITAVLGNYLAAAIRQARAEAETKALQKSVEQLSERVASLEALIHSMLLANRNTG